MAGSNIEPLLEAVRKGADPRKVIPDEFVIIRGGIGDLPAPGTPFSGAVGKTVLEAGVGVPHNRIRLTTAGEIRKSGGVVELAPEVDPRTGKDNILHVNVIEGGPTTFSDAELNPVPKEQRLR
jgi:hypothetical protein